MYAVIATGGKQYRVQLGDVIRVEKLDLAPDSTFEFEKVLMVADGENIQIGAPYLKEKVEGTIIDQNKHKKVNITKFNRRKHHMKQMGHRQNFTEIKITKIGDQKLTQEKAPQEKKAEPTQEEQQIEEKT